MHPYADIEAVTGSTNCKKQLFNSQVVPSNGTVLVQCDLNAGNDLLLPKNNVTSTKLLQYGFKCSQN